MPVSYKVLGQAAPDATTLTDLYIVPSSVETVISSLVIANRSNSSPSTFRIAITPDGATLANTHYIAFDISLDASDSTILTLGLTLNSSDKVLVYSSSSNLSFNLFGMELS